MITQEVIQGKSLGEKELAHFNITSHWCKQNNVTQEMEELNLDKVKVKAISNTEVIYVNSCFHKNSQHSQDYTPYINIDKTFFTVTHRTQVVLNVSIMRFPALFQINNYGLTLWQYINKVLGLHYTRRLTEKQDASRKGQDGSSI